MVRDWSSIVHSFANSKVNDFRPLSSSYGETLSTQILNKLDLSGSNFLNSSIRKRLWRVSFFIKLNPAFRSSFVYSSVFRKNLLTYRRLVWLYKVPSLALPYFFNQNTNLIGKFPVSLYVLNRGYNLMLIQFNKVALLLISASNAVTFPITSVEKVLYAHSNFKYLRTTFSKPLLTLTAATFNHCFSNLSTWALSPLTSACLLNTLKFKHHFTNKIPNTPTLTPVFDPIYLQSTPKDRRNAFKPGHRSPLSNYLAVLHLLSVRVIGQFYNLTVINSLRNSLCINQT